MTVWWECSLLRTEGLSQLTWLLSLAGTHERCLEGAPKPVPCVTEEPAGPTDWLFPLSPALTPDRPVVRAHLHPLCVLVLLTDTPATRQK